MVINLSNESMPCVLVNSPSPYSRLHKNGLVICNSYLPDAVMDVRQLIDDATVPMPLQFCICRQTALFLVHHQVSKGTNIVRPFYNFYLVRACAEAGSFALLWFECRKCGNANVPDCVKLPTLCPAAIALERWCLFSAGIRRAWQCSEAECQDRPVAPCPA